MVLCCCWLSESTEISCRALGVLVNELQGYQDLPSPEEVIIHLYYKDFHLPRMGFTSIHTLTCRNIDSKGSRDIWWLQEGKLIFFFIHYHSSLSFLSTAVTLGFRHQALLVCLSQSLLTCSVLDLGLVVYFKRCSYEWVWQLGDCKKKCMNSDSCFLSSKQIYCPVSAGCFEESCLWSWKEIII